MATTGQFSCPPLGSSYWPLTEGALEDRVGIGDIDSLAVYKDTAGEVEVMCLGKPARLETVSLGGKERPASTEPVRGFCDLLRDQTPADQTAAG